MMQLVEASAGTGKTQRIARRYAELVVQGLRVEQILAVTFTTSATSELKHRVRSELRDTLRSSTTPEASAHLARALRDFDRAEISTIHGFTQRALSEHSLASGVEPALAFHGDAASVITEFVRDFWMRTTWQMDRGDLERLRTYGFTCATLRNVALGRSNAPRAPLRPQAEPLRPRVDLAAATATACRDWAIHRVALLTHLKGCAAFLTPTYADPAKLQGYFDAQDAWFVDPCGDPPTELRLAKLAARIKQKNKIPVADESRLHHGGLAVVEALWAAFEADRSVLRQHAQQWVLRCLGHVDERMAAWRARHHVQTFGDLLTTLSDAVAGDDLRAALRSRYRAALVDEFQDTDPVQWSIVQRLFGQGDVPLVLVGDEKQAIYSFRGADVHAFHRAKATVGTAPDTLDTNHRSDEGLLRAFNHLFGRVPFPPVSPRHPRRLAAAGPPFVVRFLQRGPEQEEQNPIDEDRERVAAWVAADIDQLLGERPVLDDGKTMRVLARRDIAVLVRTHLEGELAQAALRARGIPSVRHSQADVLLSAESLELARLLSAVLEPDRASRVATALAGRILGRSSTELHRCLTEETAWEEEVHAFRTWSATWHHGGITALWQAVSAEREVYARLLSTPEGARAAANLRHLVEWLHASERDLHLGPVALLRHLQAARVGARPARGEEERDGPDAHLLRLESDADAVRIVTIHAAKGLQYPVVFCPSLWRKDEVWGTERCALRHAVGDETLLDVTLAKAKDHPALIAAQAERDAEGMRLLYVALTRARHRCVVYYGWFKFAGDSALGALLHLQPGEDRPDLEARFKEMAEADILGEAIAVTTACADIGVLPAEGAPPGPARAPAPAPADLPWQPWSGRRIDTRWRLSSFTGLAGDARDTTLPAGTLPEAEGIDRDRDAEAPARWNEHADGCDPFCHLPPGMKAGNCLHAILEHFDVAATAAELRRHGFDDTLTAGVTTGLTRALATPLPGLGVAVGQIPATDRRTELPFHLKLGAGVTRSAIAEVLRAHGTSLPPGYADRFGKPNQPPLDGLLKGSIDLVFRHDGRWHLADWKSTWLGHTPSRYTPAALRESMEHHDYFLQYLLYAVGLHRFLEKRVQDYDFDRHFGGSWYLYVRGMVPGETTGIVHDPLTGQLVPALADVVCPR
jgi:exodeoxyribonuclease V beta subunit